MINEQCDKLIKRNKINIQMMLIFWGAIIGFSYFHKDNKINTKINTTSSTSAATIAHIDTIRITQPKITQSKRIKQRRKRNKKFKVSISEDGKQFIKDYEKCLLKARKICGESRYTIGWGHVIYREDGDDTPLSITQKHADRLFEEDIKKINDAANRILEDINPNFIPTQGFVDGLCSLIYNCGERGISESVLIERLKRCRYDSNGNINKLDLDFTLASVRDMKISQPGHKPRRIDEYKIMID